MKLQNYQNQIKKAQLNFGSNATLNLLEQSKEYRVFRSGLRQAIKEQAEMITEDQMFVDQLLVLSFKAEANQMIVQFIDKKWIDIRRVFDSIKGEGAFFSFFMFAGQGGGQSALDKMGIDVQFNLVNEDVVRALENRANLLIQSVDQTTKERIANILEQGKRDLLTNTEISQLIRGEFGEISKHRADAIARTELNNALNMVELEAFKRNGVKEKRWVTVLDDRVRDRDRAMHNQVVAVDEMFHSDYDGWAGMSPPSGVNCRCFMEEVITGFEPDKENRLIWSGN